MDLHDHNQVDEQELVRRVHDSWNTNASWWHARIGRGSKFQDVLVDQPTKCLLDLRPGEKLLDIACGNGRLSRHFAKLGACVTAIDCSEEFLKIAKEERNHSVEQIDYHLIDATDEAGLLSLGHASYDAAVCTMALMDMSSIETLISALPKLLKPNGRFVFSVPHPCFNNSVGMKMVIEAQDCQGEYGILHSIQIYKYIEESIDKGIGIVGQPTPQYYFHRPISNLFNLCFRYGFVLCGMLEPTFSHDDKKSQVFEWESFPAIPPVLVGRMELRSCPE